MASNVLIAAVTVPLMALLAGWRDWRFAFFASGLLLAVSLLVNWIWFPRGSRDRVLKLEFFSRFRSLLSLRFFRVAVAVNLTQRMAFWGLVSYFAAFLIQVYGVSVSFLALPVAVTAAAQVAGSYLAPLLANSRTYVLLVASTSVAGGICGFVFFAFDLNLWVAVAVATLGAGLLSMTFPALITISTRFSGRSTATGVGLMGLSNQGGGVFGAALAGLLLAGSGFAGIGYMCLGVTITSGLVAVLFGRQAKAEDD